MWYLRHAPIKIQGFCIGQFPVETELNDQEAFDSVIECAPILPTRIYSSDLPSCAQLAKLLANHWRIPIQIDRNLREVSFGQWEGRSYDELQSDDPEAWISWCEHWQTEKPPGGESHNDLSHRVQKWLDAIERKNHKNELLITHAGVIRALYAIHGLDWKKAIAIQVPHLKWQTLDFI